MSGAVLVGPVLAGLLVALAVLVGLGPRGRPVGRVGGVRLTASSGRGAWTIARAWQAATDRFPGGAGTTPVVSMSMVVTQVASLLRSGLPPSRVWPMVGEVRADVHGIPDAEDLAALVGGDAQGTQAGRQAAAVVAACRLASAIGAPLASVLESIVETLTAAAEAESERSGALAGPQTTARVLLWLPAVGAALGTALGADLVGLLTGGGPGAAAIGAGVVLLVVGRAWSRRLVAGARRSGDPL